MGLELVGRGVYLRPRLPYEIKCELIAEKGDPRLVQCDTAIYSVPPGYDVNQSPSTPADQTLNQTVIEQSVESLEARVELDAKLAASIGPFSITASSSRIDQLQTDNAKFYALRTSFVPLWTVYAPKLPSLRAWFMPRRFKAKHRDVYERFFQQYGTHYVTRVWVGGAATLAFTVLKGYEKQADDFKAAINASYGVLSADVAGKDAFGISFATNVKRKHSRRRTEGPTSSHRLTPFSQG